MRYHQLNQLLAKVTDTRLNRIPLITEVSPAEYGVIFM